MKKNDRMKDRRRKSGRCLGTGIFFLGFAAMAAAWSLRGENGGRAAEVLFAEDERNQLAEPAGPELYNARAYAIMKREILESIRADPSLSKESLQVDVSIEDGIVVLRGKVRNFAEEQRIVQLAREPAGMARIDNQLKIGVPE